MKDATREIHVCDKCKGKPGSDLAVLEGCICPTMDNGRGHNEFSMVVLEGCPVHWPIGGGQVDGDS